MRNKKNQVKAIDIMNKNLNEDVTRLRDNIKYLQKLADSRLESINTLKESNTKLKHENLSLTQKLDGLVYAIQVLRGEAKRFQSQVEQRFGFDPLWKNPDTVIDGDGVKYPLYLHEAETGRFSSEENNLALAIPKTREATKFEQDEAARKYRKDKSNGKA